MHFFVNMKVTEFISNNDYYDQNLAISIVSFFKILIAGQLELKQTCMNLSQLQELQTLFRRSAHGLTFGEGGLFFCRLQPFCESVRTPRVYY